MLSFVLPFAGQVLSPLADFPTWAKEEYKSRETLFSFPWLCVGYELSSRAVASQVLSPLQRLTSVFGMGTGGPTALKTLTLHRNTLPHIPIILSRISPCRTFARLRRRRRHRKFPLSIVDLSLSALPTGAPPGTRTPDPLIKSQLLYQLS